VTLGSMLGFAVVFVLVCGAVSVACAATLSRFARHAAVERRAAWIAAAVPVVVGAGVVVILVGESLVGDDHCVQHDHHAHLCVAHGAAWLSRPWAVGIIAASAMLVTVRACVLVGGLVRARVIASRLRRVGAKTGRIVLVESERVFCFVAGIARPAIYVSTGAREQLSTDEWNAMLAHEESHIENRDLAARVLLEVLLVFAAPLVGIAIRARWESATERLRDADAGAKFGVDAVANALVRMASSLVRSPRAVAAFTPSAGASLTRRVESLLDETPAGDGEAKQLGRRVQVLVAVSLVVVLVFAGPIHHALETLLG
jgi:beta-lactamase regulating signal transducer with metallopeptidase domain